MVHRNLCNTLRMFFKSLLCCYCFYIFFPFVNTVLLVFGKQTFPSFQKFAFMPHLLLWKTYASICFHQPKEIQKIVFLLQEKGKGEHGILRLSCRSHYREQAPWITSTAPGSSLPRNYTQHLSINLP